MTEEKDENANIVGEKQYLTPKYVAKYIIGKYLKPTDKMILEPACGDGIFIEHITGKRHITGVELDARFVNDLRRVISPFGTIFEQKNLSGCDIMENSSRKIIIGDFLFHDFKNDRYDLIIGNPPYGYKNNKRNGPVLDDEFVKKSATLLKPGGRIVFILETKFLQGKRRFENTWRNTLDLLSLELLVTRIQFRPFKGKGTRDCSFFEMCRHKDPLLKSPTKINWLNLSEIGG